MNGKRVDWRDNQWVSNVMSWFGFEFDIERSTVLKVLNKLADRLTVIAS